MTAPRILTYLDTIIAAADDGARMVHEIGQAEFLADRKTQLAVVMTIVIISEACGRIANNAPEFFQQNPEIEWDKISGLRNRGVHGYGQLDFDIVWTTARDHLAPLASRARRILERLEVNTWSRQFLN